MLDAAIIGSGPAGLSAALNLKLHNKDFIWFGSGAFSSKVEKSEKIANYPGVGLVDGRTLNHLFAKQAEEMELKVIDKMVTAITKAKNHYILLAENDVYEAKTLLLATGVVSGRGLKGEQELLGRGVSYCATCDGFLYRGKSIAVLCSDKHYEHEVEYLAGMANQIYLYAAYKECTVNLPNVTRLDKAIGEIRGDKHVYGIILADGAEVEVDGVFLFRNALAPAALLPGLMMDGPHIVVDRTMATSYKGCYAAGDCTGRPYQIAKAVGEGNTAAHSIIACLSDIEKECIRRESDENKISV